MSCFDSAKRFDMVDIQNATLSGGVAVGAVADLMLQPYGAFIAGSVVGVISTLGFKKLQVCQLRRVLDRNVGSLSLASGRTTKADGLTRHVWGSQPPWHPRGTQWPLVSGHVCHSFRRGLWTQVGNERDVTFPFFSGETFTFFQPVCHFSKNRAFDVVQQTQRAARPAGSHRGWR